MSTSQAAERRGRGDEIVRLLKGPAPLVLPSAWDAGTARLLERAGAGAVAISAAGVAWSLGCSGASRLDADELAAACARACRAVAVPVIADLRGAQGVHDLPSLFEALALSGVAGVTLPDRVGPGEEVRLIDAVRTAMRRSGERVHVTAHVSAAAASTPGRSGRAARWSETLRRARACADAGADAVLVTELDWGEVVPLTRELPVPVSVDVAGGWAPPVHALARAGVRCVALGVGPLRTALGALRQVAVEALDRGSYDLMNRTLSSADAAWDLA